MPSQSQDDYLLTASEACARLGITDRTLWRYEAKGLINAKRLPSGHRRFRPSDVQQLLSERKAS